MGGLGLHWAIMKVALLSVLLVFGTVSYAQVGPILEDLDSTRSPEVRAQAEARLRALGTNALPWLNEEMALMNGTSALSIGRSNVPPMAIRTMRLAAAFRALGPVARPALPELARWVDEGPPLKAGVGAYALTQIDQGVAKTVLTRALTNGNVNIRHVAAMNLFYVTNDLSGAVGNLLQCVQYRSADTNGAVRLRMSAVYRLEEIQSPAEKIVPVLTGVLANDESAGVRSAAADALGSFTNEAVVVTTALNGALKDANERVRLEAGEALKRIKK
jgi:HEAT repeat protein